MGLNGIGGLTPGLIGGSPLSPANANTDRTRTSVDAQAQTPAAQTPVSASTSSIHTSTLPAEAPPGTDPELWKVLTSEERQHFATAGARGPLTYGYLGRTQSAPPATPARGLRLDLKA